MNHPTVVAFSLLIGSALLVSGCATPYDIGNADPRVTPVEAAKDVAGMVNHTVAWGGLITVAKNLKEKSEIEVVGYPLDSENRPNRDAKPTGRFLVIQSGYLETADYAPGRLITVVGTVTETRRGMVGEANYIYPVVVATKLQLWPKSSLDRREPSFHFGIGVGVIH